jgi:hypothetical protein
MAENRIKHMKRTIRFILDASLILVFLVSGPS